MVKERFKARVIPTLFRRKKKVDGVTVLLFFGSVDGVTVLLVPFVRNSRHFCFANLFLFAMVKV
jgi:hypothetical protein